MAIEGVIGRPGSGKTYELTRRVLAAADRDRLVFTNFAVAHPNVYMFAPDQLLDLPPGLVVIDEAHLWFPARMALKLPMSWLAGMSQTRKNGWDLLWSAQHENRVDTMVRDVTDWLWLHQAWFSVGDPSHPLLFTSASWEPENFRKPDKRQTRGVHFFKKRIAQAYNTHERIAQAEHTTQKNDTYAKGSPPAPVRRRGGSVLDGVVG